MMLRHYHTRAEHLFSLSAKSSALKRSRERGVNEEKLRLSSDVNPPPFFSSLLCTLEANPPVPFLEKLGVCESPELVAV